MIFVTIGTTEPFDRLLRALDTLDDEELVVQCGDTTTRPRRGRYVDYLPYDDLVDHVRQARVVIAHAGVGTIMTALANGKRPIVVPRRAELGEAVDDHQLELAKRLATAGLVTLVEESSALSEAVRNADPNLDARPSSGLDLTRELRLYIESKIKDRSGTSRRASSSARDGVLRS
jgi:UDP-N-acetylglucosamine transferase subunit ALG13